MTICFYERCGFRIKVPTLGADPRLLTSRVHVPGFFRPRRLNEPRARRIKRDASRRELSFMQSFE